MNLKKTIKSVALFAFLALASQPVAAQDLLARQAPVDRRARAVDTLALHNLQQLPFIRMSGTTDTHTKPQNYQILSASTFVISLCLRRAV